MDLKMSHVPLKERPRERLRQLGADALSTQELLSILLRTGTKEYSVSFLAYQLMKEVGNIEDFEHLSLKQLESIKGIGPAKALEILACIELGKRIFLSSKQERRKLNTPEQIFEESRYLFHGKKQEYFYCFYLNNKRELIERKLLFMGTIDRSTVHPREIFKEAYLNQAKSIICLHNHPSGDVHPSIEDRRLTSALREIGVLQGIALADHLIVSDDAYFSFYESGLL